MLKRLPLWARIAIPLLLVAVASGFRIAQSLLDREPASAAAPRDRFALSSQPPAVIQQVRRIHFTDVADKAGLRYQWQIPGPRALNILQTVGNGCAFLDYNGDGNLDILLVGTQLRLYRGDGKGNFTDVTREAGLDRLQGHFLGCAVGDYDNDGFDDLYISGWRTGLLLHNEHGRRFKDVTAQAGLKPQPWGTSCAWGDVDGDGYLDLYVCNYLDFGPETKPQLCSMTFPLKKTVYYACEPTTYHSLKGTLYHNLGGHRFEDVTYAWGADRTEGAGLGAAFADFDGSGRPGLAVANDERRGDLFQNAGRGRLKNIGTASGTDSENGHVHGGMGLDWADYDNDGRFDLFVATFEGQIKNLYHNEGGGLFQDSSAALGIHHVTRYYVAFGCKFLDADNDGWMDLLLSNGSTYDNMAELLPGRQYRQPLQLLYNSGGTRFVDASAAAGIAQLDPIVGRGLATGDYDNDGRVDALVVDSEGKPRLLHNETTPAGHWLSLRLIGTRSNRDGYGAVVTVRAGGQSRTLLCHADGSYLSSSDSRVHVGLNDATSATVTVRWPNGRTDTWSNLAADRQVTLREGMRQ